MPLARLILLAYVCVSCNGYITNGPGDPSDPSGGEGEGTGGGGGTGTGGGTGGGGGGGGGGEEPPPADFSLDLDTASANLALGETKQVVVTLLSINDFAGEVTLSAEGLPDSWDVTFTPSDTVPVSAGGTANATAIVTIPTDAEATTTTIAITGTATPGARMADLALEVRPELVLRIPQDALNNPATSFGGTVPVRYVAPGTKVTWINDDTVTHRIHTADRNGMNHQPNDMTAGSSYEVVITEPGTYEYQCHIHPQMQGVLVVTNVP